MTAWSNYFIGNQGASGPAVIPVSAYFFGGNQFNGTTDITDLVNSLSTDVYRVAFDTLTVTTSAAAIAQNFDMLATLCNIQKGFTFGGHTKSQAGWNGFGFITKVVWATEAYNYLSSSFLSGPTTRNVGLNGPTFNGYVFGGVRFNSDTSTTLTTNEVQRFAWSTETFQTDIVASDQYYRSNPSSFSSQDSGYIVAGFGGPAASNSYSNYPPESDSTINNAWFRSTTKFNYSTTTLGSANATSLSSGIHSFRGYNSSVDGYFNYTQLPAFGHTVTASKLNFSSSAYTYGIYQIASVLHGSHTVSNDDTKAVMVKMDPYVNGQNYNTYVQRMATMSFSTETYAAVNTAVGRTGLRAGENFQSGGYL